MSENRLYDTFSQLVEIDSPSLGERGVCDFIKARLLTLGFEVFEDGAGKALGGNSGNLYGYLGGNNAMEPILLCAHMDTVEPSRGKKCLPREDGVIVSAGETVLGADDLGGVAEILEAVARLLESGEEHGAIEVLFCVAEEIYGLGAGRFDVSRLKSRQAFVLDLSGPVGYAALKAPSIISFEAVFLGRAAHAGFAFSQGVHAVAAAAWAVSSMPLGQVDEETTCNVGSIEGGGATNIVPDFCRIRGEARSFSHESARCWLKKIEEIAQKAAEKWGAECVFRFTEHVKAYETSENSPAARRFKAACAELELPGELIKTFGGSDNNHLVDMGLDGLVIASAMNNCHSTGEYTSLADMETVTRLIIKILTLHGE